MIGDARSCLERVGAVNDFAAGEVKEAFAEFDASEQAVKYWWRTPSPRHESAIEHLLFKLMEYVEARHAGLPDVMEQTLDHLGDPATDDTKDDEAVRRIARSMIVGVRKQGAS